MYVIEKNGEVVIGPSNWTLRMAKITGLRGNVNPPPTPYQLSDGRIIRSVCVNHFRGETRRRIVRNSGILVGGIWKIDEFFADNEKD